MENHDKTKRTILVVPVDEDEFRGPREYVGQTLADKYRLERLLGTGGMGSVYLTTHLGTGRYVALKLIAPQFMRNAHFVERFRREAQAAGRLRHPHIVDVTDFGFADLEGQRVAYLVMEFLDGCTLGQVLAEERRLPVDHVVDILQQVCAAVHEAHQQGVIHRDLKPDNIWLQPNSLGGFNAKVLDFGIAQLAETKEPTARDEPTASSADLTQAGTVLGTPLYMSPEQCGGLPVDKRSDIYSLGIIAYQLLAGTLPFEGDSVPVMEAHRRQAPEPLRRRHRKTPRGISRVVMSALAKDPNLRPRTAMSFANELRANSQGLSRLYRRAFALYCENFPAILKLSFVAHVPLMVVTALAAGATALAPQGESLAALVVTFVLGVVKVAATMFTASTIGGLMAFNVAQMEVAPFKTLGANTAFTILRQRWRPFFKTAVLAFLHSLAGFVLLIVPGFIIMAKESMWAPVVLMEGKATGAALKRSRELARRSWFSVHAAFAFQLLLPWFLEVSKDAYRSKHDGGMSGPGQAWVELSGLSSILVLPLISMVSALLYLKMRQLGGETLEQVAAQVNGDLGLSKWEKRIRSRLLRPPSKEAIEAPPVLDAKDENFGAGPSRGISE